MKLRKPSKIKVKVNSVIHKNGTGISCDLFKGSDYYYPSCRVDISLGKAGNAFFTLGKLKARDKKLEAVHPTDIRNFSFDNNKHKFSFVYEGRREDDLKSGFRVMNVLHNYDVIFDNPDEYYSCKEKMIPFLKLKGKFYQNIGREDKPKKIDLNYKKLYTGKDTEVKLKIIKKSNNN